MSNPRIRTWNMQERPPSTLSPRPLRRIYERDLPEPVVTKTPVEPVKVTESNAGGMYVEAPPPRPRQEVGLSTVSFTASHEEAKLLHAIYERSPGKMTFSRWLRAVVLTTLKIPPS